uniref:Uncharacterized protein n=1 Tax=Cacopsylla melanoneura TaxID=428564 RepID=A0A8D8Z644_9HEMI
MVRELQMEWEAVPIKRAADGIVARGNDIPNVDELVRSLKNTNTQTELYVVSQEDIEKLDSLLPAEPILPFKGTMAVHQLAWNSESPLEIQARRLSCLKCSTLENCVHYGIGKIKVTGQIQNNSTASTKLRYEEVYSDSETDEDSDKDAVEDDLINLFAIVQFKTKGYHKHYIGIIQYKEEDGLYRVKFMRKKSGCLFVFPDKEDISYVDKSDIVKCVSFPNMGRRGETYEFENKEIKKFHSTLH